MIVFRDPITVRGQTIRGSADRSMCLEQAARHRHLGLILVGQLAHWASHLSLTLEGETYVRAITKARIEEHFAAEREYKAAVAEFDDRDPGKIYDWPEQLPARKDRR